MSSNLISIIRRKPVLLPGRNLEVRGLPTMNGWQVAVFENGKMISQQPMIVPSEWVDDAAAQTALTHLIDLIMEAIAIEISAGRFPV